MCTLIDAKETVIKRDCLKQAKNVAWKIVDVKYGEYYAPMQPSHKYSKGINTDLKKSLGYGEVIGEGVFHFFSTRKLGREILKAIKAQPCYSKNHLKLVKVFYDKQYFFGIGSGYFFANYLAEILDKHKNNSVCATQFEFAEEK